MERVNQKLIEVMLEIRLTYAGNKLVELMHLNARVAKPNLSSSSKKENSFFLAKERCHFVLNLTNKNILVLSNAMVLFRKLF